MSSSSVGKATTTTNVAAGGEEEDPKFDSSPYLRQLGVGATFVRLRDIFLKRWGVSLAVAGIVVVLQFLFFLALRGVLKGIGLDEYAITLVYAYVTYKLIVHDVVNAVAAAATAMVVTVLADGWKTFLLRTAET
jgi:hypothetical protein